MSVKNKNINRGAAIFSIIFALLFFVLISRFVQIQTFGKVNGEVLAVKAEEKYSQQRVIEAKRGTIYDRNGQIIVQDTSAFTVVAILDEELTVDEDNPQHVVNPEETARKLAPILNIDVIEVERILKKDKNQVEFGSAGRNISYSLKQEIEALDLSGISFIRDSKRYYPSGLFASYVIGYAQKERNEYGDIVTIGQMGLEKSLNDYLREEDGYVKYQSDVFGISLPNSNESIVSPDNGDDVYLTIDQKIQTFVEDAMNRVDAKYEPSKMIAIVADPKTGEILAMSTRPSFDPNSRDIENYLNDAIAYRFEPGSTMKVFTLAAAVEEGVYNGNEFYQSGSYAVDGSEPIRDYNKKGWGQITFSEGVQRSSNVAFAILANEKLGTNKLREYLSKFGLDRPTGIDLPGEVSSLVNFEYERDKVSAAFGQGTAITPIQQIQAATAIANDGKMMKPYVIDQIVNPDTREVVLKNEPEVVGTPISKETSREVLNILETVVTSTNGTGKAYNIEGYRVAGKTGTAQIPNPEGGYLTGDGNNIFSFLGMAPKEDPELLIYVAVKQPKLEIYEPGSNPVSAIFNPVMKNSLQYLNIQPKENSEIKDKSIKSSIKVETYIGSPISSVEKRVASMNLTPIILGKGNQVIAQVPEPERQLIIGERILLRTEGDVLMPDLTGWSLRDVMKLANLVNLKPNFIGSGYVVKQNLLPGSIINEEDYLIVDLKSPSETRIQQLNQDKKDSEDEGQDVDRPLD